MTINAMTAMYAAIATTNVHPDIGERPMPIPKAKGLVVLATIAPMTT